VRTLWLTCSSAGSILLRVAQVQEPIAQALTLLDYERRIGCLNRCFIEWKLLRHADWLQTYQWSAPGPAATSAVPGGGHSSASGMPPTLTPAALQQLLAAANAATNATGNGGQAPQLAALLAMANNGGGANAMTFDDHDKVWLVKLGCDSAMAICTHMYEWCGACSR
jgi:hypothetical protein